MQTLKYVVKRILLSVLILFGVSIVIYSLSRMMPTDFIDNQYSSALQNGTMTQGDVDRIKEIYGLAMPDAYLSVTPGEGSDFAGKRFTKNTKKEDKYNVDIYKVTDENGNLVDENVNALYDAYVNWYADSYDCGKYRLFIRAHERDESGAIVKPAEYEIYSVRKRGGTSVEDTEEGGETSKPEEDDGTVTDKIITLNEELTLLEKGTVTVDSSLQNKVAPVLFTRLDSNGNAVSSGVMQVKFRKASFWNKTGAVLGGYFTWLFNMLRGDLGMSFKYKQPVARVIMKNMGISFAIAFVATILQFLIAIPLGIKAATKQYGVTDYTVTVFAMIGISLPTFFLGALFIRIFAVQLGWFPVGGAIDSLPVGASWLTRATNVLWHMVLPMTVLVILSIGGLMRYTRTNTLEVLNADYIRTARAKGLSEHTVVYKHAFRNTLIPLVTLLAGILPSLFGGAMITEQVFSIPGIGKIAYDALVVADVPFIMGYNMFIAVLTVLGTLFSDLMYAVVDPRVKLGR